MCLDKIKINQDLNCLIDSGESEALVEFLVHSSIDSDSSFKGYKQGLVDRGYSIIKEKRIPGLYVFRIGREYKKNA